MFPLLIFTQIVKKAYGDPLPNVGNVETVFRSCRFKTRISAQWVDFAWVKKQCLLLRLLPACQGKGAETGNSWDVSLQIGTLVTTETWCSSGVSAVQSCCTQSQFGAYVYKSQRCLWRRELQRDRESKRELRALSMLVITYWRRKVK